MPKKDFKNVNDLFITPVQPAAPEPEAQEVEQPAETPEPVAIQETKSRRLQLLIRPSTDKALTKEAKRKRISKNELINQILEAHTKGAK